MVSVAQYITEFQEKVSSPAVDEMKSKARDLLNQEIRSNKNKLKRK